MNDNWAKYGKLNREFDRVCRRLKRDGARLALMLDRTDRGGLGHEYEYLSELCEQQVKAFVSAVLDDGRLDLDRLQHLEEINRNLRNLTLIGNANVDPTHAQMYLERLETQYSRVR